MCSLPLPDQVSADSHGPARHFTSRQSRLSPDLPAGEFICVNLLFDVGADFLLDPNRKCRDSCRPPCARMARSAPNMGMQPVQCRTKVKTGCLTCRSVTCPNCCLGAHFCRIRKVKCDEKKPSCQKCISTGRVCDGYESVFRITTSQRRASKEVSRQDTSSQDIALLNRYFSIKTIFGVPLACTHEAQQILHASQTNPPLRHAIASLRSLRQSFESGDGHALRHGLQQYNMALSGLASKLSFPGSNARSALLCCQVFISIEQARENYAVMGQHIIQGLNIMHECRARPAKLPFLDVFVIKLFAAPCKFAERRRPGQVQRHDIEPGLRAEIVRIAMGTLAFLAKLAQGEVKAKEKLALLKALEAWRTNADQEDAPELLSVSFLRFFHGILRIVLLGALDVSPDCDEVLLLENKRLQNLANDVTERVNVYRGLKAR